MLLEDAPEFIKELQILIKVDKSFLSLGMKQKLNPLTVTLEDIQVKLIIPFELILSCLITKNLYLNNEKIHKYEKL